jgi:hypothetical protein
MSLMALFRHLSSRPNTIPFSLSSFRNFGIDTYEAYLKWCDKAKAMLK